MKTMIFPALLLAAILAAAPVRAQQPTGWEPSAEDAFAQDFNAPVAPVADPLAPAPQRLSDRQPPSGPADVAMVFHKLAGVIPDFNVWALETEMYKSAPDFEKEKVMEDEASALRSVYTLTMVSEPLRIATPIVLSPYSFKNKGFLIGNLHRKSYFPFVYAGVHYAVAIPDLEDQLWIPVADDREAMAIDRGVDAKTRELEGYLHIEPVFASQDGKLTLDGQEYNMISGRLLDIVFYAKGSSQPLWQKSRAVVTEDSKQQRELLDLYQ